MSSLSSIDQSRIYNKKEHIQEKIKKNDYIAHEPVIHEHAEAGFSKYRDINGRWLINARELKPFHTPPVPIKLHNIKGGVFAESQPINKPHPMINLYGGGLIFHKNNK
jgi:hypothetical protein